MSKKKTANKELLSSIEVVLSDTTSTPQEIAKRVLETLEGNSAVFYARKGELSLLTGPARVLIVLTEQPDITQRAMAIYLGISEAAVQKSLKILIDNGLVAKTKVKGRNVHKIIPKTLLNHSDINHVTSAVRAAERQEKEENLPF
jgi:predicted HTH transcriptional regulator